MVICLKRGADLHVAQPIPLPLTVSCFSKIQIGFTFLVAAHPGSPGKGAVKRVCVCVCVCVCTIRIVRSCKSQTSVRPSVLSDARSSYAGELRALQSRGAGAGRITMHMAGEPRHWT